MPQRWRGRIRPDENGNIPVDAFNDFLRQHPDLGRSPVRATIEFMRLRDPSGLATIVRGATEADLWERSRRGDRCELVDGGQTSSYVGLNEVLVERGAGADWIVYFWREVG